MIHSIRNICVALVALCALIGPARAQVGVGFAPILIPEWEPGKEYRPDGAEVVGIVSSTYDASDPRSYVETWRWTTGDRPDMYAVQSAKDIPALSMEREQERTVEDASSDGCASPPDAPDGETYAVYNATTGSVPTRVGTLIVDAHDVEHWYLAPTFRYAGDVAMIVRRDPAADVESEFTHYIRAR